MVKRALICFLVLACSGAHAKAPASLAHSVESLDYGMALYADFQGDPITALTYLLAAEQRGRLANTDVFASLLMGNLYLSVGLIPEAEKIFTRLQKDSVLQNRYPQLQDQINFYLGKFYYYQQQPKTSAEFLNRLAEKNQLTSVEQQERYYYLANLAMQSQQLQVANTYLNKLDKDSVWRAYISHNLALALVAVNQNQQAYALWNDLTKQPAKLQEIQLLQQRARLAQGLTYLRQADFTQAEKTLQELPLTTPWLPAAILALASSQQAESIAKQSTTKQLKQSLDKAQQHLDWLSRLPGASYEQSQGLQLSAQLAEQQGNLALAWSRYQQSFSAYQRQQEQISQILNEGFASLYQQWQTGLTPAELYSSLETDKQLFQQRQQHQQLQQWQLQLENNARRLPELQWMLAARQQAQQQRLNNVNLLKLQARHTQLVSQAEQLNTQQSPWQWATPELLAQQKKWQTAQNIFNQIHPQLPNATVIQLRLNRLRGALLWQLQEQSLVEQANGQQQKHQIQLALADNAAHLQTIQGLLNSAPNYLVLSTRVSSYQQKIAEASQQLTQVQAQYTAEAKSRIRHLLLQQQQLLQTHIADVHYHLARLSEAKQ